MGKALNGLSKESLAIYADKIPIDKYHHHLDSVNSMLEEIKENRRDFVFNSLQSPICEKWDNLLAALYANEDFLGDIVISSYSNLVLNCMFRKYAKRDVFFKELQSALALFEEYLFAWYPSHTRAMSVYFLGLTRLYMLRLVQVNLGISWEEEEDLEKQWRNVMEEAGRHRACWKHSDHKIEDIL